MPYLTLLKGEKISFSLRYSSKIPQREIGSYLRKSPCPEECLRVAIFRFQFSHKTQTSVAAQQQSPTSTGMWPAVSPHPNQEPTPGLKPTEVKFILCKGLVEMLFRQFSWRLLPSSDSLFAFWNCISKFIHLFVIYTYLFVGQIKTPELHSGPSSTEFYHQPFLLHSNRGQCCLGK